MRLRTIGSLAVALGFASFAAAQTKITGTIECGKPDPELAVEAGDQPGHAFSLSKVSCNWTKPLEIAGSKTTTGISVSTDEITGTSGKGKGQHVSTLASGDKFFARYQGSAMMKEGAVQSAEGTWSFSGGTGKLAAIKGKGTYKGKGTADGKVVYEVEGEYQLPKP